MFATGVFKGHHHTVIPPLLTWIDGDAKTRHTIVGPYFDWKNEHAAWWGVFPLLWNKKDDVDRFTLVPPVFFRFADDDPLSYTTVVPPFYHRRLKDMSSWGLLPLVFHKETPELKSTTVPFALFHYANGPETFRLVTPVFGFRDSKPKGRLWVTPVYQRQRGDKNLDGVAPLWFRTWDDRDMSKGLVIAPIFWHFNDPANDALVVLPFMGRWFHEGISSTWLIPLVGRYKSFERDEQTWWVFPTFHYAWTENSWQFNIHPLVYRKESPEKSYRAFAPIWFDFRNHEAKTHRFAVFPLYWDFKNFEKHKRSVVAFPLYWDFQNERKKTGRKVAFPLYWDFRMPRSRPRPRSISRSTRAGIGAPSSATTRSTPITRASNSPRASAGSSIFSHCYPWAAWSPRHRRRCNPWRRNRSNRRRPSQASSRRRKPRRWPPSLCPMRSSPQPHAKSGGTSSTASPATSGAANTAASRRSGFQSSSKTRAEPSLRAGEGRA